MTCDKAVTTSHEHHLVFYICLMTLKKEQQVGTLFSLFTSSAPDFFFVSCHFTPHVYKSRSLAVEVMSWLGGALWSCDNTSVRTSFFLNTHPSVAEEEFLDVKQPPVCQWMHPAVISSLCAIWGGWIISILYLVTENCVTNASKHIFNCK